MICMCCGEEMIVSKQTKMGTFYRCPQCYFLHFEER